LENGSLLKPKRFDYLMSSQKDRKEMNLQLPIKSY